MAANMYDNYYRHQAGSGLPVYAGVPFQRGHGIGSILSGLFRGALPILKNVGKSVGRQLLKSGLEVANDVAAGGNFKKSLKRRVREGASSLVTGQSGSGVGVKRRRAIAKNVTSRKAGVRRGRKRTITRDIFG